jgi:hypothetical protein
MGGFMSKLFSVLVLLLCANVSYGESLCLFGEKLLETARMRDLIASQEKTIAADTVIRPFEKNQLITAFHTRDIETAIRATDRDEVYQRRIWDNAHHEAYYLYMWLTGDIYTGVIFQGKTNHAAARIHDGNIVDCVVYLENYDALPWLYIN